MKRLPRANTNFGKTSDTQLIIRAGAISAGLTANAAYFAAPPFTPTDINNIYLPAYIDACTAAIKGTKSQTAEKTLRKQQLIEVLRADATYVNQRVYAEVNNQTGLPNYENARVRILSSGYEISKEVTRPNPNGNTKLAVVLSTLAKTDTGRMNVNGVLRVRVKVQKKYDSSAIKTYWIQYRLKVVQPLPPTPPIPVNAWSDFTATSTDIQVTGVDAGIYECQVAPIAGVFLGKDQLNWTNIFEVIVT